MIELLIPLFSGSATTAIAIFAGIRVGAARARAPKALPEPICGCGHNLAFHDEHTGLCHCCERMPMKWSEPIVKITDKMFAEDATEAVALATVLSEGHAIEWQIIQCTCRRYVGPEMLATLILPELAEGVAYKSASHTETRGT